MQTEPVVSVIIPVHNGGVYLRECLDSVLAQTLDALEVIVVDDASTDDTPEILASCVESARGKVRVITQSSNQGVSAARNLGIANARGTYIAFVDADDLVRPRMYAHLAEVAETNHLDVVSCGIQVFEGQEALSAVPYPMPAGVHSNQEVRELLQSGFTSKLLWFPFRSLYRRTLVQTYSVRFDTQIRKGEDSLFNLEVLSRAQQCAAVADAYYLYRKHAASVTARPLPSESGNSLPALSAASWICASGQPASTVIVLLAALISRMPRIRSRLMTMMSFVTCGVVPPHMPVLPPCGATATPWRAQMRTSPATSSVVPGRATASAGMR